MASLSCNSGAYTLVGAAAVIAWTLGVAGGSYALTGTATPLVHGHPVTAVSGLYTLTGTPIQVHRFVAEPAGYILQGTAVTFHYNPGSKTVSATSGAYVITGTTATRLERALPYTKGQYSLTGSTTALLRSLGPKFAVASGSYSVTGATVGLVNTATIGSGDYQLTGTALTLRKGKSLVGLPGNYALGPNNSTKLEQSRHFSVASGTYAITDTTTLLRYSASKAIFVVINSTNYALTGSDVNLLTPRHLVAASGVYVITEGHTVFRRQYDSGSYALVGTDVALPIGNRRLTATSGMYILGGTPTPLVYSIHNFIVSTASYSISGPITNIQARRLLSVAGGSYTLAGLDVTLRATRIQVDAGIYSLSGTDADLLTTHTARWSRQPGPLASFSTQSQITPSWDSQTQSPGV